MKTKEKETAIKLRQEGMSLKTISMRLSVAKSTVSLWTKDIALSEVASALIAKAYTNGQRASQISLRARTSALLVEASTIATVTVSKTAFNADESLVLCSLLYWCEGGKAPNDNDLRFTNSDPGLISTYLSLLRKSTPVREEKFRILMHLHGYHDEFTQLDFWSKVTRIPKEQFNKTYWKPNTGKRKRTNYQGCINVYYHDVKIARMVYATARAFLKKESKILGP